MCFSYCDQIEARFFFPIKTDTNYNLLTPSWYRGYYCGSGFFIWSQFGVNTFGLTVVGSGWCHLCQLIVRLQCSSFVAKRTDLIIANKWTWNTGLHKNISHSSFNLRKFNWEQFIEPSIICLSVNILLFRTNALKFHQKLYVSENNREFSTQRTKTFFCFRVIVQIFAMHRARLENLPFNWQRKGLYENWKSLWGGLMARK